VVGLGEFVRMGVTKDLSNSKLSRLWLLGGSGGLTPSMWQPAMDLVGYK
jgi:hypothetical protein